MQTIGQRIKQRRKELNLSVDEVAERLGKNRATVYRYESNDIENLPTTILEPLANVLNTTPAYLMGWEDEPYNDSPIINAFIRNNNTDSKLFKAFLKQKLTRDYDIGNSEYEMLKVFSKLNSDGKIEAIKRIEELTYIPKYQTTYTNDSSDYTVSMVAENKGDYMAPVAAHNDYADDEEEQKLIQEDLDDL